MKSRTAFLVVLCLGLSLPLSTLAQGKKVRAKKLFDKGLIAEETFKRLMAAEG